MLADPRKTNLSFGQPLPTHHTPWSTLVFLLIKLVLQQYFFKNNIKTLFNKIGLYEWRWMKKKAISVFWWQRLNRKVMVRHNKRKKYRKKFGMEIWQLGWWGDLTVKLCLCIALENKGGIIFFIQVLSNISAWSVQC